MIPYEKLSVLGRGGRILATAIRLFGAGEYLKQAIALTYYTVFAIVPLAALFFGIAKGFAMEAKLKEILTQKLAAHGETLAWIYRFADTTLQDAKGGVIAGVGVIFLFVTVILLASGIEDTFNLIWNLPKRKNIINKVSNYLAILVVTPILLIAAGSTPVLERAVTRMFASFNGTASATLAPLLGLGAELVPLFTSWLIFGVIYYFVPNTRVRVRSAATAALVAGTLFFLLQCSWIWLQTMLGKYNTIYGSFAILPLFLLWLQYSWAIVLFGAELGFVCQNAKTGRFEESGRQTSFRLDALCQLAIARLVCRKYESGHGASSEDELQELLPLSSYRARALLDRMTACGILLEAGDAEDGSPAYVPALPASQLTPVAVLRKLGSCGINQPDSELAPHLAEPEALLAALEEGARQSAANRPLKEI